MPVIMTDRKLACWKCGKISYLSFPAQRRPLDFCPRCPKSTSVRVCNFRLACDVHFNDWNRCGKTSFTKMLLSAAFAVADKEKVECLVVGKIR